MIPPKVDVLGVCVAIHGGYSAACPKPEPMPESVSLLGMLQDAFLFSGDFKWMFYFTLVGFCAANARAILGATPNINFFHGCALMVLSCFGGSTMAAIMCGKPVAFVCNEALVTVCLAVWLVMYLKPGPTLAFLKDTKVGSVLNSVTYEIQRCHVLMNCTKLAAGALPAALAQPSATRVAVVGPLIAGVLGGCGGGFMPLNKGLDPLANGTNWRVGSAAVNSLWLFLATQFPPTKSALGLCADTARFLAVAFFVAVPLLEMKTGYNPFGANPLVAPKPKAGAVPAVAATPATGDADKKAM